MAVRTDIQYVQFYVDGSAARKLEKRQQTKHAAAPRQRTKKRRVVVVDPVAILGIFVAAFMLVFLLSSFVQYRQMELRTAEMDSYIQQLQQENQQLRQTYHAGYDLDRVQEVADALGMIPASDATQIQVPVEVPQEETVTELSWWDSVAIFLAGFFA